ncbi:hypothetical protein ACFSQJ_18805 [Croceitalea marina]|uniref:Uncharacterized protein n=1 Tax=Croceitalea marina TaxID=1775166 RepID=A0ABW5N017_9FLAO
MTSKEFREKVKAASTDELYFKVEELLSKYGLENVKLRGLSISPNFEIADQQQCIQNGGRWICRTYPNGIIRCKCVV